MEDDQQNASLIISPESYSSEFQENHAFFMELEAQTDRGCAVLAGAFLEQIIREAVRAKFANWDSPRSSGKPLPMGARIIGTESTPGELGFLDQCRLAYCLGAICSGAFRDLERIARIRNLFAHGHKVQSFADHEKVLGLCKQLESVDAFERGIAKALRPPKPDRRVKLVRAEEPRKMFEMSLYVLWCVISNARIELSDQPPRGDASYGIPITMDVW